jgi:23S rRNA (cytidine2498-2'-O)-methyltransferase
MPPRFLFAVCQAGAEQALKGEMAREHPGRRFAFSRPGFLTFRLPDDDAGDGRAVFARTWGWSVGKATGTDDRAMAQDVWKQLAQHPATRDLARFAHLHVWQRAAPLPGDDDFDASAAALAGTVGAVLLETLPASVRRWTPRLNETAHGDELVLDCVLVGRHEWWFGWHVARSNETRWPGGVPPLGAPARMISRAYLKLNEALLWSELPVAAGDRCVEIGSAPGGASLALLERGCLVTGVDPAEMDPAVLAHPHFTHVRARAREVQTGVFRDCRWLVIDANVAPNYTLDTVRALLARPGVRPLGLALTLKLTDPALAAKLPHLKERLRDVGYGRVRLRQLAFNRQEICAIVTNPR